MSKIFETRIKKTKNMSFARQKEIKNKLGIINKNNYIGNCKVDYTRTPRRKIINVEPIEGDINTYFDKITKNIRINFFN
jgi:hypothetical protein